MTAETITDGHRSILRHGRVLGVLAAVSLTAFGVSVAPASAETCPNAQLRAENNSTQLPECRAYEQVTPPYKEGFAVLPKAYSDEGVVAYISSGNFPGNGSGNNQYIASRSSDGWSTSSPTFARPSYEGILGSGAEALSTDLRSSLWLMRLAEEASDVADYYLRDPAGDFIRVGPGANPETLLPGSPGTGFTGEQPRTQGASSDLSHVLVSLDRPSRFPGDTAQGGESLYEYVGTGKERPELVGVDNLGHQLSQGSTCSRGITPDGRVVFFDPGCDVGRPQAWLRVNATTTIDASASLCTRTAGDPGGACNEPAPVSNAGYAADGSRVFLTTTQQLVNGDTDQTNDLYECDIPPGTPTPTGAVNACESLTEVSGTVTGADVQNVMNISDDGSRVYFVALGVLAHNRGANDAEGVPGEHVPPTAGENNLYVWEKDAANPAGRTTFVAQLQVDDMSGAQSTADGRYLVFSTASRLLASDTDEAQDVYRYDAETGILQRLSTDTSGSGGNQPGFDAMLGDTAAFNTTSRPRPSITSDGDTVVFFTKEALSPTDDDGTQDVYSWHDGRVSLISSGRLAPEFSTQGFASISSSGTDIFFTTDSQLTPTDGDTGTDIYDARVDGGFPVPAPSSCTGESCRAGLMEAPAGLGPVGSTTVNAPGSPVPPAIAAGNSKPRPSTRAQRLAKALKACRAKHNRRRRAACERQARHVYRSSK